MRRIDRVEYWDQLEMEGDDQRPASEKFFRRSNAAYALWEHELVDHEGAACRCRPEEWEARMRRDR